MAANDKLTRIELTDYSTLIAEIDADITAQAVSGFYVSDVDIQSMLKTDGSTQWTATIIYTKGIAGSSGNVLPINLAEVQGTVTNVNGGNRDAGTQTVTLADDDPAVVALQNLSSTSHNVEQILVNQSSDNGVPSGTNGSVLDDNTIDVVIEIVADNTITNVDCNVWLRATGSDIWYKPSAASIVDLQDQTDDRWGCIIRNARTFGTRVYIEIDNYAGSGNVNAWMNELQG